MSALRAHHDGGSKRDVGDDAVHIESPWLSGVALCGTDRGFNFVTLNEERPGSMNGCWTCLYAAEWLSERLPAARPRAACGAHPGEVV